MAYSEFILAKVREDFNLALQEDKNLFAGVQPSDLLKMILNEYLPLAIAINPCQQPAMYEGDVLLLGLTALGEWPLSATEIFRWLSLS
jgi:hypothetical protein